MRTRVLVVSASMGAGHDGAARELVRRLKADGHVAEMKDFLTSGPAHIGDMLRSSYEFQMKYVPWSYDLTYRTFYRSPGFCPPIGRIMTRLMAPDLLQWAKECQAEVIVSTYPLTSYVLGELRRQDRLTLPTINFITDFGVHPFWIHPGLDLNLTVHPRPAGLAEKMSGRPSIATGPMVSPRFAEPQDRAATRTQLGLKPGDKAVLIVSGSWGVGNVTTTFRTIAGSGRFVPIGVCGRDERLLERLSKIPGGRALGWTDDMPALMAAADALVENAGGLTAMEGLSVGLPIISFRPIAGHGKENTAEMQAVGLNRVAGNKDQLLRFLELATNPGPARQSMIEAGRAMFVADPARFVEHAARFGVEGLSDRAALEQLRAAGGDLTDMDLEQLSGVASRVEFDFHPADRLRALVTMAGAAGPGHGEANGDGAAPSSPGAAPSATGEATAVSATPPAGLSGSGTLAPVVPIGVRRPSEGDGEGGELQPTGTDGSVAGKGGRQPRRPSVWVARTAALAAAVPLIWAALTSGVAFATSLGAGVAHPARGASNVAFLGVRLSPSQLSDPTIASQLSALHATAVVDERTASADPSDVQRLVGLGIDVENGGAGAGLHAPGHRIAESPWKRADGDVAAGHLLSALLGQPVRVFVPGRRLNVFDLVACHNAHAISVVPDHILQPADVDPLHLTARHTYLVNGAAATNQQVEAMLAQLQGQLAKSSLSGAPLSDLV